MSYRLLIDAARSDLSLTGTYDLSPSVEVAKQLIILSLLSQGQVTINDVPDSPAVHHLLEMIEFMGGSGEWTKNSRVIMDPVSLSTLAVPDEFKDDDDIANLLFATLLGRYKEAVVFYNQACDYNLFKSLGYELSLQDGYILGRSSILGSQDQVAYQLPYPEKYQTLQAISLSVLRQGTTTEISNISQDLVVDQIIEVLVSMGASIESKEKSGLVITGVERLHQVQANVLCDTDEAIVVVVLAAIKRGDLEICGLNTDAITAFLSKLQKAGVNYQVEEDGLRIWYEKGQELSPFEVKTDLAPGFSSRWIAPISILMAACSGESALIEATNRSGLRFLEILNRAQVEYHPFEPEIDDPAEYFRYPVSQSKNTRENPYAIKVFGPKQLVGFEYDLERSYSQVAALIAGLVADVGTTELNDYENLLWYFPNLVEKLNKFGANIKILEE